MACSYSFKDKQAFDAYIEELKKLKEYFESKGEVVVPFDKEFVLYNEELGVAGTPDLITVDKEGKYRIYDLKTKKFGAFTPGKDGKINALDSTRFQPIPNRVQYSRQMSMYDILAHNTHGIEFEEAGLIPLEAKRSSYETDFSVTETRFVLDEEATRATLYKKGILPVNDEGKIDYKADPAFEYKAPEDPVVPESSTTSSPKRGSRGKTEGKKGKAKVLSNSRGMFVKPDTKSSLVLVDKNGNFVGFTAGDNNLGPQTALDSNKQDLLDENRDYLESPKVNKGTKIKLVGVETENYEKASEDNRPQDVLPIMIVTQNEAGEDITIGRVPTFYSEEDQGGELKRFREAFYSAFEKDKNHTVEGEITDKFVQTSSNINNTVTEDGEVYFHNLIDTFGEGYYYDENGELQYGEKPIVLLSMRGPSRDTVSWNFREGTIEDNVLTEEEINRLAKDLGDTAPFNMRLSAGQIGVVTIDPVTGKYKVIPISTRNLTEQAVDIVFNAFINNDLKTIHDTVGVNQLEDFESEQNNKFLKFTTFEVRDEDRGLFLEDGTPVTTLDDFVRARDLDLNIVKYSELEEEYKTLQDLNKDFVVYFYSDTKARLTGGDGIVKINASQLQDALDGEEISATSVSLQIIKKTGKTKFRVDDSLNEDELAEVSENIINDFKALLGRKKFQVNVDIVNKNESYFVKGYTSTLTGKSYPTYFDFLIDENEVGERTEGKGSNAIISTDVKRTEGGAIHHDIGIEFTVGEAASTETHVEEVVEDESTKQSSVAAPDTSEGQHSNLDQGNPWGDVTPSSQSNEVAAIASPEESSAIISKYSNRKIASIIRNSNNEAEDNLGKLILKSEQEVEGGRAVQEIYEAGIIQRIFANDGSKIQRLIDHYGRSRGIPLINLTMNAVEAGLLFDGKKNFSLSEKEISEFFNSKFKASEEQIITQEYLDTLTDSEVFSVFIGRGYPSSGILAEENRKRGNLPFRVVAKSTSEETTRREEAVQYLEERFPGFGVTIFEKAQEVGGGLAHGWFEDMGFYIWNRAEVGTEYHEAFHGMFRMFLTNDQRAGLYKEAQTQFSKEEFNEKRAELKRIYKSYTENELTELAYEELMAEKFRDYVMTQQEETSGLVGKLLEFFRDLYVFLKAMVTNNLTMRDVFRIANARSTSMLGRTKAKMLRNSEKFLTENSLINKPYAYKENFTDEQVKETARLVASDIVRQVRAIEGGASEYAKGNPLGDYGAVPMYYLSRSLSIQKDGKLEPLPFEVAKEYKRAFKKRIEGDPSDFTKVISKYGIRLEPPSEITVNRTRVMNVFHDVGIHWEDSTDESKFENVEQRGWRHYVNEELDRRAIKTKFRGNNEIELDEDEDTIIDKIYSMSSEEVDQKKKLSQRVKFILSTIENPVPNFLGFKTFLDPDTVYRMIIASAVNSENYQQFRRNLISSGRAVPELKAVVEAFDELNAQDKARIRYAFTLVSNEFFSVRKRNQYNEFGELTGYVYELYNPDRRSVVLDGFAKLKQRTNQEVGENKYALYKVRQNPKSGAREFTVIQERVAKVSKSYEKFIDLLDDRRSDDNKLFRAASDVLFNLGVWYGNSKSQHDKNFITLITKGFNNRKGDRVAGREAINELFYPRGTDANIELLIDGLENPVGIRAGKSVFEAESSTVKHLLNPLQLIEIPYTNSFVDAEGKSKYPVNLPKGYNEVERSVRSREFRQALNNDEIFSPHRRVKTLLAYLLDRPEFRSNFKIKQFNDYTDVDSYDSATYKTMGDRTSIILTLNAFLNNGSDSMALIRIPTPGDRQSMWTFTAPRLSSEMLSQFEKNDIIKNMIYAELAKIQQTRRKVRDAIYDLNSKTDEEVRLALSELIFPYHIPNEEIDMSNPKKAAAKIAKLREEGKVGTGEEFTVFDVLSDEIFFGKDVTLSDYIDEYLNHIAGETSAMSKKKITAFESKVDEMVDTVNKSILEFTEEYQDKLEELDITQDNIDPDALDKIEAYDTFEEMIEDFVFTDVIYRTEYAKAFRGGIDFAGNPTKFFKRMSTMGTPGHTLTLQSELENEESAIEDYGMLDTFYEGSFYDMGWTSTKRQVDQYVTSINELADAIGGEVGEVVRNSYQPGEIEGTDGTALISMQMYRAIRMGEGNWDIELDEQAYENYRSKDSENPYAGKFVDNEGNYRPVYILKPIYDGMVNIGDKQTPFVDKTAYVPLIKEYTRNNPTLEEVRKRMEVEEEYAGMTPLHVMHAVSAKKLSRLNTVALKVDNAKQNSRVLQNITPIALPGRLLKIAQPVVERDKTKIKIQRQFRKNIIANINKDATYNVAGVEMTGQQVFDMFQEAIAEKIKRSMKGYFKSFGINDLMDAIKAEDRVGMIEAKSKFLTKLQSIFREEIEDRELNRNYLDAIKIVEDAVQGVSFNIPLSFPTLERKFENMFFALFKSRVLKQEMKGMEVPQIAEIGGYTTDSLEQKKLGFTRVKGEKVIEAEMAMSEATLKKFGYKVGDKIVAFRVPNQGMSSMIVFKIARTLPDNYKKAIMVPTPITKLMGSDFDIDKMFLMFAETDKSGKRIVPDYKGVKSGTNSVSKFTNQDLTNVLMDVAEGVLLSKRHLIESVRPLDSPLLSDIRDKMIELAPQVRLRSNAEGKEIIYFSSPLTEIEMEKRNKLGIIKRGAYANTIAGRNVAVHGDVRLNPDNAPIVNGKLLDKVVQKSVIDESVRDFIKDSLGVSLLLEEYTDYYISLYLSAAVDAANDPLQHYLNDTPATTPVISLMLSVGADPATLSAFLNQPLIRRITEKYATEEATPGMIRSIAGEVLDEYNLELPDELITFDLNIQELVETLDIEKFVDEDGEVDEGFLDQQLNYVSTFLAIYSQGRELSSTVYKAVTADNASNIGQSAGIQAFMDMHDAVIFGGTQSVSGAGNILVENAYPFEKTYVEAYQTILEVSQFLFNGYTPAVYNFKDHVRALTGKVGFTIDQHNLITRAVNYHLLTKEGSPLAPLLDKEDINKRYFGVVGVDENGEEIVDGTKTIIAIYDKINEAYPKLGETSLMRAMSPESAYLNSEGLKDAVFTYMIMRDRPRTPQESNEMISTFEDILLSPGVFLDRNSSGQYINKDGSVMTKEEELLNKENILRWGEMLIQNSLITKGFSLGAQSYSELIPSSWLDASGVNEFFKNEEIALDDINGLQDFTFEFMRQFGTALAPQLSAELVDGSPLTIEVPMSEAAYNSKTKSFTTFAASSGNFGKNLYVLDSVKGKGKSRVGVYTKVMTKGSPRMFIEHNLRTNGKIDNRTSLIRIGEKEDTGVFMMPKMAYRNVSNFEVLSGKKEGEPFIDAYGPFPTIGTKRRPMTSITKKCK